MIAKKYMINSGRGKSKHSLVSFDNALQDAKVGNYNLVRLSSILPAECQEVESVDITEGSLLPIAYATIQSSTRGEWIASAVAVGFPKDKTKVGVIMEHSERGPEASANHVIEIVESMVEEAFTARNWELDRIMACGTDDFVNDDNVHTTFAFVAEW